MQDISPQPGMRENAEWRDRPCDVCGVDDAVEIPEARHYTGGEPIHVCRNCGFVYYRRRRTAQAIADSWTREMFGAPSGDEQGRGKLDDGAMVTYSALTPYAKARQVFVGEMMAQTVGLVGKYVVDIGAGQGQFLDMLRRDYGARVFGIEPSAANCERMNSLGIDCYAGIIEDFLPAAEQRFDAAAIIWTLENCESCRGMISAAHDLVVEEGYLVVATGSRILVPFKKPLQYYFNPNIPQDTHAFYFSYNSLKGLLAVCGFDVIHVNRYTR